LIEQLNGRVALVTGGTDGVGKEIARAMARRGARLIIVGRDAEKGARAQQEIRAFSGNKDVDFVQADLSLMRQTRRLGDEVAK
jgi:NAD(P)-dependent dehydrogenase (short-subunit alcohol dehydrogenase family)